eukprot:2951635-Heterocapsa_arctica.AAC.1
MDPTRARKITGMILEHIGALEGRNESQLEALIADRQRCEDTIFQAMRSLESAEAAAAARSPTHSPTVSGSGSSPERAATPLPPPPAQLPAAAAQGSELEQA